MSTGCGDDLLDIEVIEVANGSAGVDELNDIVRPSYDRAMRDRVPGRAGGLTAADLLGNEARTKILGRRGCVRSHNFGSRLGKVGGQLA